MLSIREMDAQVARLDEDVEQLDLALKHLEAVYGLVGVSSYRQIKEVATRAVKQAQRAVGDYLLVLMQERTELLAELAERGWAEGE